MPKKSSSKDAAPKQRRTRKPASTSSQTPAEGAASASEQIPAGDKPDQNRLLLNASGLGLPTILRPFVVQYFPSPAQIRAECVARAYELETQRTCAERTLARIRAEWASILREKGQRADFNVAFRTKFGQIIAPLQYVILVDVESKYSIEHLHRNNQFVFPDQIDRIPIKVRRNCAVSSIGTVLSAAGIGPHSFPAAAQIRGGIAIGSDTIPGKFGTLGICIRQADNTLVGVTNSHVGGADSSNIVQPPGTTPSPTNTIGSVFNSVLNTDVDGAMVNGTNPGRTLLEGIEGLPEFSSGSYRFLKATELPSDFQGVDVIKCGAATHRQSGFITITSMTKSVSDLLNGIPFQQVIEVQNEDQHNVTAHGDSGSALISVQNSVNGSFPLVIGLNFAMSDDGTASYAIPFGAIIENCGLTGLIPESQLV